MNIRRFETLGLLGFIAILMGSAAWLQHVRETRFALRETDDQTLYLTSRGLVRRLPVAYQTLAADLYWIRAVQYYGGTKQLVGSGQPAAVGGVGDPRSRYDMLYPLLDLTTTLDPRFNIAYRFGAIFLAEPYPGGPGRPDQAIALLEKGLQVQPNKWEYMQDIGFVHYWWRHDYEAAASWFERGSKVPGAPWWLRSLAASTLTQGGDRQSSRLMWQAILEASEVDWVRRDAERRLLQLQALDQIDILQRAIDQFTRQAGRVPASWREVAQAGVLPGAPADPAGAPYDLDAAGRVQVRASSPLFPMPVEPARNPARPPS